MFEPQSQLANPDQLYLYKYLMERQLNPPGIVVNLSPEDLAKLRGGPPYRPSNEPNPQNPPSTFPEPPPKQVYLPLIVLRLPGQIWVKVNISSTQDPPPSALVTLYKYRPPASDLSAGTDPHSAWGIVQTCVTKPNGWCEFPNLSPGPTNEDDYMVRVTPPPDYIAVNGGYTKFTDVLPGAVTLGHYFEIEQNTVCPRGIQGVVWNDLDGDSLVDPGEKPIEGSRITLINQAIIGAFIIETTKSGIFQIPPYWAQQKLEPGIYVLEQQNAQPFPESTTPNSWILDLTDCTVELVNFGDRAESPYQNPY